MFKILHFSLIFNKFDKNIKDNFLLLFRSMETVYNSEETLTRVEQMQKVHREGLELFKKKNVDYGDAFANYGAIGVLVRMGDKIQRLQSITSNNIILVNDEKIRDTLIDLHNYSAMAIMLLDENNEKLESLVKK